MNVCEHVGADVNLQGDQEQKQRRKHYSPCALQRAVVIEDLLPTTPACTYSTGGIFGLRKYHNGWPNVGFGKVFDCPASNACALSFSNGAFPLLLRMFYQNIFLEPNDLSSFLNEAVYSSFIFLISLSRHLAERTFVVLIVKAFLVPRPTFPKTFNH